VENGLVGPSPEAHLTEGPYIARSLVRDRRAVPLRVLNATFRDQKLTKESHLVGQSHWWPHQMWNSHRSVMLPRSSGRDYSSQAKLEWRWIPGVGKALHRVRRRLFYGQRWLRTDGRGPTDSPAPKETPLAKQVEVGEMLDDVQRRGLPKSQTIYLVFSAFTSRPSSLLACIRASTFFMAFLLSPNRLHHQRRSASDVCYSISVLPSFLGPS
jgi:hypothetical protein